MSEKCLPEVNYQEHPGFQSALFLNLSDYYNCATPKRDMKEGTESCRLSIESLTPGTTPIGSEKRKSDSSFKFCLSKDLMKRLEESSPFNVYSERKGLVSDICLSGCDELCEDEEANYDRENVLQDYTGRCLFGNEGYATPSTYEQSRYFSMQHEGGDGVMKTLNFGGSEGKENKEHRENKENEGSMLDPSCYSSLINNLGVFSSFGKNVNNVYNLNQPYYYNSIANSSCGNSTNYNKFNGMPFNSDSKVVPKSLLNVLHSVQPSNHQNPGNNCNTNINMYGKNGWICLFCKNFNYEVRTKCNRCSKGRDGSTCTETKPAITVNHNLISASASVTKNDKDSPTHSSSSISTTATKDSSKKKKPFVERAGDWNCYKCKNLNFSFRVNCNRCQLSKKESEKLSDQYVKNILNCVSQKESSSDENEF